MPIKSNYPSVQIDERQFAFQFMEKLALHAHDSKKIAIVGPQIVTRPNNYFHVDADQQESTLSYRNLRLYITALSDFLHENDFDKSDIACIVSPNCSQYAIVFGAVSMCGGVLSGASNLFIEGVICEI